MRNRIWAKSRRARLCAYLCAAAAAVLFLPACKAPAPAQRGVQDALPTFTVTPPPTAAVTPPPTAAVTPPPAESQVEATATSILPLPTAVPLPAETPVSYTVAAGDHLQAIAARFDVSAAAIQAANDLADANLLLVGQTLIIPRDATDAPQMPPAIEEDEPAMDGVLHNGVRCPEEEVPLPEGAQLAGRSAVCGLPIPVYQLSEGDIPLILVGGIHGGYEWNTVQLTYEMYDYLRANPNNIPSALSIYFIPNANPDGLYAVSRTTGRFRSAALDAETLPGRTNGRLVDLNRNWDCRHTPAAVWRDTPISGGPFPFSEAESQVLSRTIMDINPAAVLFWHSAAAGVYASGCDAVDPASKQLAQVYGLASGFPIYDTFDSYDITGDAANWLAAQGVPAITVELSDHRTLNWEMNLSGVRALMAHLAAGSEKRG